MWGRGVPARLVHTAGNYHGWSADHWKYHRNSYSVSINNVIYKYILHELASSCTETGNKFRHWSYGGGETTGGGRRGVGVGHPRGREPEEIGKKGKKIATSRNVSQ